MKQSTTHETRTTHSRSKPSNPDRSRPEDEGSTGSPGRRTFLRAVGSLAAAGALAGCTDGNGGTGDGNGGTDNGNDGTGNGGGDGVDEWLSDADNYDSVTDMTGEDAVTVEVGPGSNEMTFEPAAIRIAPGTTVTWEWVGSGYHNVVDRDGAFDSGGPEEGATFEHAFDAAGTALYYCDPHRSAGMKGAVVVEGEDGDGTASTQG